VGVEPLIEGVNFEGLIADKAFDSDWIIENLNERGAKVVISQLIGGPKKSGRSTALQTPSVRGSPSFFTLSPSAGRTCAGEIRLNPEITLASLRNSPTLPGPLSQREHVGKLR
jgi:hypothetical protein